MNMEILKKIRPLRMNGVSLPEIRRLKGVQNAFDFYGDIFSITTDLTHFIYLHMQKSCQRQLFLYYRIFSSRDSPIVCSGISKPKLSATVAPMTAKVSASGSLPLPCKEGE